MEKTEIITKANTVTRHNFYCDEGGKYLGSSEELYDGYYTELGIFDKTYCIDGNWYKVHKNLCEKCRTEYIEKIKNALYNLGFVKK